MGTGYIYNLLQNIKVCSTRHLIIWSTLNLFFITKPQLTLKDLRLLPGGIAHTSVLSFWWICWLLSGGVSIPMHSENSCLLCTFLSLLWDTQVVHSGLPGELEQGPMEQSRTSYPTWRWSQFPVVFLLTSNDVAKCLNSIFMHMSTHDWWAKDPKIYHNIFLIFDPSSHQLKTQYCIFLWCCLICFARCTEKVLGTQNSCKVPNLPSATPS